MPWKEMEIVEQRFRFMEDYLSSEYGMSELCREYGVSRCTGYKWLERYERGGVKGLEDRSRAPHESPQAYPNEMREWVKEVRCEHGNWGPKKLLAILKRRHPEVEQWPWPSTVGSWLKQAGLCKERKRRRVATPTETLLTKPSKCNRVWYADYKGWFRTGDGRPCYPLTISEGYSRYLLRCQGYRRPNGEDAKGLFVAAFCDYGMPEVIRTDNGSPFASIALAGLSRLSVWWIKLGIIPERIKPGKPQQNGAHERMHRTLKEETQNPVEKNLRAQQRRFDAFRKQYNEDRPHEALEMRTPMELFKESPRAYPRRVPKVEYDSSLTVRRVKLHGEISWKGRRVFLTEVLAGEPVALEQEDERYWTLYFCTIPLGILDARKMKILDRRRRVWKKFHPTN